MYIMIFSHVEMLCHAGSRVQRTEAPEGLQNGASGSGSEVQLQFPFVLVL